MGDDPEPGKRGERAPAPGTADKKASAVPGEHPCSESVKKPDPDFEHALRLQMSVITGE